MTIKPSHLDDSATALADAEDAHRRSRYPELSGSEFRYLLEFCAQHNLNSWARPVYPVFRTSVAAEGHRVVEFELTIEGLRTIAHRTGQYAGNKPTQFRDDPIGRPHSATAFVYRLLGSNRYLFSATVFWSERNQMQRDAWSTMPRTMLGKCAEAAALRVAFPEQLGGLYVHGELAPDIGIRTGRSLESTLIGHQDGVEPDDCTPTSKMSFTLKLIHEFGLTDPSRRDAMLQAFRERYPHLQSSSEIDDPPIRFYATVLYHLASEPHMYGVNLG